MRLPGPADLAGALRDSAVATAQLVSAVGQLVSLIPQVDTALSRIVEVAEQAGATVDRISVIAEDVEARITRIAGEAESLVDRVAEAVRGAEALLPRIDSVATRAARTTKTLDTALAPVLALEPVLAAAGELDVTLLRSLLGQLPDLVGALSQVGPDVRSLRARVDDLHHLAVGLPGGKRLLRKGNSEN